MKRKLNENELIFVMCCMDCPQLIRIYFFDKQYPEFWLVVESITRDELLQQTKLACSYLSAKNLNYEFLILERNQLDETYIPKPTAIFNVQ